MASSGLYYIYIVRCQNQAFYTGITNDLKKRLQAHSGQISGGAKYTRSHPITAVEAVWQTDSRSAAQRMEYAIKRLSHLQKQQLIAQPHLLCTKYVPALSAYSYRVCTDMLQMP